MLRLTRHLNQGMFIQDKYAMYLLKIDSPNPQFPVPSRRQYTWRVIDLDTNGHNDYTIDSSTDQFSFLYKPTSTLITCILNYASNDQAELKISAPRNINIMRIEICLIGEDGKPVMKNGRIVMDPKNKRNKRNKANNG